jgi:transcription elongation factor Elf1
MGRDFFELEGTVECPNCGNEVEFSVEEDNNIVICDQCDSMLLVDYNELKVKYEASII